MTKKTKDEPNVEHIKFPLQLEDDIERLNKSQSQLQLQSHTIGYRFTNNSEEEYDAYLGEETKDLKVKELAEELNVDGKKLLRKIDIYVLLPFCLLFFISNINRSCYALLYTGGITSSLNISNIQYYGSISAFYGPYVLLQSFSNLLLKSVRPHFWMSISILIYGAIVLGQSFIQDYAGLLVCQVFHGLFQSSCDSGLFYIISHYYERKESQKRISLLYSSSLFAVIFDTAVMLGITRNLPGGLEPWRTLLIVNGSITMFSAFVLFYIIPDFPEGVRFFSDNEVVFIVKRLEIYCGKSGYALDFKFKDIFRSLKDPMVWFPAIVANLFGAVAIAYTIGQYLAMILSGNSEDLMYRVSLYQYIAAFGVTVVLGFVSDFIQNRSIPLLFCILLTIYGSAAILFAKATNTISNVFVYRSDFLFVIGAYSSFPLLIGWVTFNLNGHLRKSIITSLLISSYDMAGIYSYMILSHPSAYFQNILAVAFGFACCCLIGTLIYVKIIYNENQKKRTALYKDQFDDLSSREKLLAGDRNPSFDYMY